MEKRLEQIFSDSTITDVLVEKERIIVKLLLYTEENLTVVFDRYYSFSLNYGWSMEEGIDSLFVLDNSELLIALSKNLKEDDATYDKLYEFQLRKAYDEPAIVVVAESILINDAKVALE